MKVLFIHTHDVFRGGEDSVVANEIELLRARGIETDLLSFNNDNEKDLFLHLQLPFNWRSYRETRKKLISFKPDLVHLHNLHFAGTAAVIYGVKRSKIPMVCTLHNYRLLCPSGTLFHKENSFMDAVNKRFSLSAIKKGVYLNSKAFTFWLSAATWLHELLGTWDHVDRFIVYSKYAKQIFAQSKLKNITDRMVVKPNFSFDYLTEEPVEEVEDYYLYIGALTFEKGISVLLETFADNKLKLIVIGNGPLEKLVKGYALHFPNIRFKGYRSKQEVFNHMKQATAVIYPSLWQESFAMVIAEAFSKGTPVIASSLGYMKDMVENGYNGLRFEPNNYTDLRAKIDYYQALSAEEKAVYRKNARQTYLDQYTPEVNADQLTEIYNSILQPYYMIPVVL